MLQVLREFKVGRPQLVAGVMLLAFAAQALWVATSRRLSDLEYEYIASGMPHKTHAVSSITSPFTAFIAALPVRVLGLLRSIAPHSMQAALAIPRPWLLRLPFVIFGVWLGGALWWVARRLFDDYGGYTALALYCTSPALLMISSNIGPEIILAWSIFGLVYTAIGVAHTLYAPPKKWAPRTFILGLSIGFAVSTVSWSWTVVLLSLAYMLYLAPERRGRALLVILSASAIGAAIWAVFLWLSGPAGAGQTFPQPHFSITLLRNLAFVFADGYLNVNSYLLVGIFIVALTVYGSWARCRYFGNTAPLLTAFAAVLLFSFAPTLYIWTATLGLSFVFIFIGGIAADLLETPQGRWVGAILGAAFLLRAVLGLIALGHWIGQNPAVS
jgi:hypothetical protein